MNQMLSQCQIIGENKNTIKDRREGKGRVLAISRNVYRLQNTDIFYVESESSNNMYHFVKFKPGVFEWCCCPDNSRRYVKCKHLFAIEFAIRIGTLKDIDKLPAEVKRYGATTVPKSYKEDEYSFSKH
jgi:predicted nucleic acid-binding Zn finger protein